MSIDETVTMSRLGFGFDYKKTNHYKVVVLANCRNTKKIKLVAGAHVYSLRRNSWRMVNVVVPRTDNMPKRLRYIYKWFLHWSTTAYSLSVVSFDLAEESFQETPMADFPVFERNRKNLDGQNLEGRVEND
ncbi:hypothetical protein LguiA_018445 [Lonicera macranthoides]